MEEILVFLQVMPVKLHGLLFGCQFWKSWFGVGREDLKDKSFWVSEFPSMEAAEI